MNSKEQIYIYKSRDRNIDLPVQMHKNLKKQQAPLI